MQVPISVMVHSWLDAGLARDSVKAAVFVSFFNPARAKSRSKVFVFWILPSRCGCRWSVAVRRPARRFSRVGCTSSQFLVLIPAGLCLIRSGLSSRSSAPPLARSCLLVSVFTRLVCPSVIFLLFELLRPDSPSACRRVRARSKSSVSATALTCTPSPGSCSPFRSLLTVLRLAQQGPRFKS
jgi:hypothetical protein